MNKAQAARFLGISVRTLQRYMSAHRISFTMRRNKAGEEATFDREELQRFKKELNEPRPVVHASVSRIPAPEPTSEQISPDIEEGEGEQTALAPRGLMQQFALSLQDLSAAIQDLQRPTPSAPAVPIESKLMLTLKEACELSGVSVYRLKLAIKQKKLRPIAGIGRGHGKIRRSDLEAFVKNL